MDLRWQVARIRKCIDLGEREELTFRQLSKRGGVVPHGFDMMGLWLLPANSRTGTVGTEDLIARTR